VTMSRRDGWECAAAEPSRDQDATIG
jgi:hypothetical protein